MLAPAAPLPRVLLVGAGDDLAGDLKGWLGATHAVVRVRLVEEYLRELNGSVGVVVMVERDDGDLELLLPELARLALERGIRVIRLARDTGGFARAWDSRVLHLPRAVRAKVLLAAVRGLAAAEGRA